MVATDDVAVHAREEGLYEAGVLLALIKELKPVLDAELKELGIEVDGHIGNVSEPVQALVRRLGFKALRLRMETGGWVKDTRKRERSA